MKIMLVTLITALLFSSDYASAKKSDKSDKSDKSSKHSKKHDKNKKDNIWEQLEALQAQVDALEATNLPAQVSINVDCNAGESLSDALLTPAARLDITFSGSCYEDVSIDRGNMTLAGAPGAEIQGEVSVDSEGGTVEMSSVAINNSPGVGLTVNSRSNVEAVNLHINGSTEGGLVLINSTLECAECTMNNNGFDGLLLLVGSRALVAGQLEFNDNGAEGIELSDSSTLRSAIEPQSIGAIGTTNSIDTSGNGGFAMLTYGASATFLGDNTHLNVDQNANGVTVATGATGHFLGTVSATDNGLGFAAIGGSIFLGSTLTATDNNIGVFVNGSGKLRGDGTAISTDNNFGFFLRSSFTDLPSIVAEDNVQSQVFLQDGSIFRAASAQVTGDVFCDGTEVINSSFVCGTN